MPATISKPKDHPLVKKKESAHNLQILQAQFSFEGLHQDKWKPIDDPAFATDEAKIAEIWQRQEKIARAISFLLTHSQI